jgi:hypothetical protein
MFLRISWYCVVNVVADMRTMSTAVRILVLSGEEDRRALDGAGDLVGDRPDGVVAGLALGLRLEVVEQLEEREEERGLDEDRQAAAERVGARAAVEIHDLRLLRLLALGVALALVLLLDLLHLGLDELHPPR